MNFYACFVWLHHQQQQPTELALLEGAYDALQIDIAMSSCTMTYVFVFVSLLACTQRTNKDSSAKGYDMMRRK